MLWNAWNYYQEALTLLPASPVAHQPARPSTHFFDRSGERLLVTIGAPQETTEIWHALKELPAPLTAATRWLSDSLDKPETPTPPLVLAWQLLRGSYCWELPPAPGVSGHLAREQILPQCSRPGRRSGFANGPLPLPCVANLLPMICWNGN